MTYLPNSTAVQALTECLTMLRRHCDDKAAGGLGIKQRIVTCDLRLTRHNTQVEVHAAAPSKGHLSGGDAEAAIRAVVTGTNETTLYGLRQRLVQDAGT